MPQARVHLGLVTRMHPRPSLTFRSERLPETSFEIHIRAALLPTLREMYHAAASSGPATLNTYLGELVENEIVEFRRLRIVAQRDVRPAPVPVNRKKPRGKIQRMRPEVIQTILFLYNTTGLNAPAIAQRFHVSTTTVKRILRIHD